MTRKCSVATCGSAAVGFSRLCSKHKARKRRHGEPDQRTITKGDLAPHLEGLLSRIERNPSLNVWTICDQRWKWIVEHAKAELSGKIHVRHERQAAKEVLRLASAVPARSIAVTSIAMYLLQYAQPHLFRSERAFRAQLVRRVRSLHVGSFQTSTGASDGRNRRVMRELPPMATGVLANWLVELFGPAGVKIARLIQQEREEEENAELAYRAALRDVA